MGLIRNDKFCHRYVKLLDDLEAATRNIQGFARFLNECAARASQVIDYSKVAVQSKVSRTSSLRFYEILEDTLIAQRVQSYEVDGVDTIKHPKLYFFDVGVLNGILNNFTASSDRLGIISDCLSLRSLSDYDKTIKELYLVGLKETQIRKITGVTVCGVNDFIKRIGL